MIFDGEMDGDVMPAADVAGDDDTTTADDAVVAGDEVVDAA